nr:uncharacterized protein LOC112024538 [Quercus suber]POF09868.1 hypothetical protein CFP56_53416 [Quercus suber]
MAASVAGRSTLVRAFCRASMSPSSATRRFSLPPCTSNFVPHRSPTSSPPLRLLRRELSSLQPVHSAIASACLVSKLPREASTSTEGRFANYLSPI